MAYKSNIYPAGFLPPHVLTKMSPSTPILVGFSGGSDSGTLLHLLCRYSGQCGAPIYAVHVNHGIRGDEADRDENFCRRIAEKYGVKFFSYHIDVPKIAEQTGKSIETAARDERYAVFEKVMQENGIPLLAVAHNADDNLETIIFNITRGCALTGVCGIPQVRECGGGMLIRPILGMSKDDILGYCRENGIVYVTDSTNTDTDYSRNRIRTTIIPEIKKLNGTAERAAGRMSGILREDDDFLDKTADKFISECCIEGVGIPCAPLNGLHRAVASRVVRTVYAKSGVANGEALEYTHINAALDLSLRIIPHSSVSLPGGVDAVIESGMLCFIASSERRLTGDIPQFSCEANEGENFISQINCGIFIGNTQKNINIYKKSIKLYIDSDKIKGTIFLRSREGGDRIRIGGMDRSLKKLMCDKKIPLGLRYRLPVVCDGETVIAVPMIGVCDGYRIKADAEASLCIQFYLY